MSQVGRGAVVALAAPAAALAVVGAAVAVWGCYQGIRGAIWCGKKLHAEWEAHCQELARKIKAGHERERTLIDGALAAAQRSAEDLEADLQRQLARLTQPATLPVREAVVAEVAETAAAEPTGFGPGAAVPDVTAAELQALRAKHDAELAQRRMAGDRESARDLLEALRPFPQLFDVPALDRQFDSATMSGELQQALRELRARYRRVETDARGRERALLECAHWRGVLQQQAQSLAGLPLGLEIARAVSIATARLSTEAETLGKLLELTPYEQWASAGTGGTSLEDRRSSWLAGLTDWQDVLRRWTELAKLAERVAVIEAKVGSLAGPDAPAPQAALADAVRQAIVQARQAVTTAKSEADLTRARLATGVLEGKAKVLLENLWRVLERDLERAAVDGLRDAGRESLAELGYEPEERTEADGSRSLIGRLGKRQIHIHMGRDGKLAFCTEGYRGKKCEGLLTRLFEKLRARGFYIEHDLHFAYEEARDRLRAAASQIFESVTVQELPTGGVRLVCQGKTAEPAVVDLPEDETEGWQGVQALIAQLTSTPDTIAVKLENGQQTTLGELAAQEQVRVLPIDPVATVLAGGPRVRVAE